LGEDEGLPPFRRQRGEEVEQGYAVVEAGQVPWLGEFDGQLPVACVDQSGRVAAYR
jgi:hypothetical protein